VDQTQINIRIIAAVLGLCALMGGTGLAADTGMWELWLLAGLGGLLFLAALAHALHFPATTPS
jgi:hypothetical protein